MEHPTPETLRAYLTGTLLPAWIECGIDTAPDRRGYFHERLGADLAPLDLGYTRLLSQCRQVFAFGELALLGAAPAAREHALAGFEHLCEHFRGADGGWIFARGTHPAVLADTRDLYAHAFVLLACATSQRLEPTQRTLRTARTTLDYVRTHFAAPGHGFHEALDADARPLERVRRQNPHMHLLEGCLAMYTVDADPAYMEVVDELLVLLRDFFYDPATRTLGEFFTDDLRPHPTQGHLVEPGHHFEWIWLLSWRLRLDVPDGRVTRAELGAIRAGLYDFAGAHGEDPEYGGFYGEVDRAGAVVTDTKRLWPATEALKACAHAGELDGGAWNARLDRTLALLFARYFRGAGGAWNEVLDRELRPAADHLPATTMYHLVMGCRETLAALSGD